jgi:hypothetical protein
MPCDIVHSQDLNTLQMQGKGYPKGSVIPSYVLATKDFADETLARMPD